MRLHALQSMHKQALALEIHRASRRQDLPFHLTPRPELMYLPAPILLRIGAEVAGPVLPDHNARTCLRELQIDDVFRICTRFDSVALSILADGEGTAVGREVVLIVGEL